MSDETMNEKRFAAEGGIPDAFYSAFEERFRGSREQVAQRQSIYLPILEKAKALGSDASVLDIGCGRGEWLELLGQRGYAVRGVDLNEETVLRCREQGMDVVLEEGTRYMRTQPAETYAAVTSFHVVEHLPFARLVEFLGEIHRVLRPGGIMIVETPNPENILVGACTFHLDPTHGAPIPPALLQFTAEQAGFADPRVARVNADSLGVPLASAPHDAPHSHYVNSVIGLLNLHHYVAPDYAIVAQKDGGIQSIADSEELDRLCGSAPADFDEVRRLDAESVAREAEERAQQAEAEAREAEERAQQAEARTREAEARTRQARAEAQQAQTTAEDAEARTRETARQLEMVCASFSWRVTRPLRWLKRVGRPAVRRLKSLVRRVLGAPLRWLLARSALRDFVIRRLARHPAVDSRVRAVILKMKGGTAGPSWQMARPFPQSTTDLPPTARRVLEVLDEARAEPTDRPGQR
jgi:SAM-dependent methyltransferase